MDFGALFSALKALEASNPFAKKVIDEVAKAITSDPEAVAQIGGLLGKIAELKGEGSVTDLLANGGLVRAIVEKASSGFIQPEKKVTEMQAMQCDGCGKVHYRLVESISTSPVAAVVKQMAAS